MKKKEKIDEFFESRRKKAKKLFVKLNVINILFFTVFFNYKFWFYTPQQLVEDDPYITFAEAINPPIIQFDTFIPIIFFGLIIYVYSYLYSVNKVQIEECY